MKSWAQPEPPVKIVLTGPECTGKSTLARELTAAFGGLWIPEYARQFMEKLKRPYNYHDVCRISRRQFRIERKVSRQAPGVIFFDTHFIITKVWFIKKYGRCPRWFLQRIGRARIDLFLLCLPDLPWEADPVRENGGEARAALFREYESQLRDYGFPYAPVSGFGRARAERAEAIVREFLRSKSGF